MGTGRRREIGMGGAAAISAVWVWYAATHPNYHCGFLATGIVGAVLVGTVAALLVRPLVAKMFSACFMGSMTFAVYLQHAMYQSEPMFAHYAMAEWIFATVATVSGLGAVIALIFGAAQAK